MKNHSIEEIRIEAVKRYLSGESVSDVARDLGKGRRWLYRWARCYQLSDDDRFRERSRRPLVIANKTDDDVERLVVEVGERL